MPLTQKFLNRLIVMAASVAFFAIASGCAGAGEGAVKGATSGALAGAASGLVSALIWGGDPAEFAARGATAGATIGAIGGAVQGSNQARTERESAERQQQQEIDQIRRDIGNDAFNGVVALAECKHEVAIANARVAAKSKNSNHALAGLWVEALSLTDTQDVERLNLIVPELVRWDRAMETDADVKKEIDDTYAELLDIRTEFHLPRHCNA
jgi:hypothetical protein